MNKTSLFFAATLFSVAVFSAPTFGYAGEAGSDNSGINIQIRDHGKNVTEWFQDLSGPIFPKQIPFQALINVPYLSGCSKYDKPLWRKGKEMNSGPLEMPLENSAEWGAQDVIILFRRHSQIFVANNLNYSTLAEWKMDNPKAHTTCKNARERRPALSTEDFSFVSKISPGSSISKKVGDLEVRITLGKRITVRRIQKEQDLGADYDAAMSQWLSKLGDSLGPIGGEIVEMGGAPPAFNGEILKK